MREIKFRAWDDSLEKMISPENEKFIFYFDGSVSKIVDGYDEAIVVDNTAPALHIKIMQYTGLKDKNGAEIYDGDILSFDGYITVDNSLGFDPSGYVYDENSNHAVTWNDEMYGWDLQHDENEEWKYMRDTRGLMIDGCSEVIGNIYENPELLSQQNAA